jgi:nickel-dependent lactate racemase
MIPEMLVRLRKANPRLDITFLVATGCHRGTKKEELIDKLGEKIVREEKIIIHDCDDEASLVTVGQLPSGADLRVNRLAVETDLLLAEGFIEPHFFAGFSGGRKSVFPGVCSRVTVLGNHCSAFIDSQFAKAGSLDKNPINIEMEAALKLVRLDFILNVVINEKKKIIAAFAGHPIKAHRAGCAFLKDRCVVRPKQKADIVVTSNGGEPLDQNVYQAVKGLSAAELAVSEGGAIIICAKCADGIGGDGFYKALKDCKSPAALLEDVCRIPMDKTVPDQWQYQILARILKKHKVYFVTEPRLAEDIGAMKMEYVPSLDEAIRRARAYTKSGRMLVIPDGVSVVVECEE